MQFSIVVLFGLVLVANAQYFNNVGSNQPACLVTGNKLFSHGNYIRDLRSDELEQIKHYKQELSNFQKKLADTFSMASFMTNMTSMPTMPTRPNLPSFCTSNETTLYILGACSLQNYKIYIGGKFARDLSEDEKVRLNEFAERLSGNNQVTTLAPNTNSTDNYSSSVNNDPSMDTQKNIVLDFCQEF